MKIEELQVNTLHKHIIDRLDYFVECNKIPNILLYGEHGCGKTSIMERCIYNIYKDVVDKDNYILRVNCAFGKGIQYIRDNIKFFAKTNINNKTNDKIVYKSIIFYNAERLTIDAQSALRRCIEVFNNTTRFFMVVNNISHILHPILSRFCTIYVSNPHIHNRLMTYYECNNINNIDIDNEILKKKRQKIKYIIKKKIENIDDTEIIKMSRDIYKKGISGIDIIEYIRKYERNDMNKYIFLCSMDKIRQYIRHEYTIIYLIIEEYRNAFLLRDRNIGK